MNKKISQFELTTELQEQDLITLVQNGENKNITAAGFTTELSETFATNERVDEVEESVSELDTKVDNNYNDLTNKIEEGDNTVTSNLSSTINSYYDVLENKIITLDTKHDTDMSEINGTVQEWIDDIDNRSTLEQLQDALNRLTVAENTITALAEIIANGGGSGGEVIGYHTQPTSTITSLQGYYKGTNANPLVSTDTLNQALSKLENQVDAVASSSGALPVIKMGESTLPTDNNMYTAGKVKEDYIFKSGDTVPGRIIYTTGIQGGTSFRSGWDGVGASLYPTNSKWNLELDNLFVRGSMTVNELTVNEIKAVGGDILVSIADMKCTEVEEVSTGYKCFFDDEDGTKYNEFIVNDQAICQKFDGKDVKRYWRAVTEVGSNFIVLSKDICEPGSAEPSAGDEIILLGHRVEGDADYNEQMSDRRNAIFISAKGENAPRIAFYSGIDDFSLEGKDKTVIGKDSKFVGTITVVSGDGTETSIPIYRGKWSAEKTYYYYDYVSYNGSLWIATVENTNKVPSEDSIYWELYVPKGEDGKAGDDVAKWVEITGSRMFLYNSPDYTGTPTPTSLALVANVYGIANPSYQWTDNDHNAVGYGNSLVVTPAMLTERTGIFRCTVLDTDTDSSYYDEVQIAKLANGAEGLDAYYIDLTNYSASVPFDASGQILIDPTTIYTDVYAYHGINEVTINKITAQFTEGKGTCSVSGNRVTLQSLESTSARITLTIDIEGGVTVTKDWYINQSKDGENGFNGEDAVRTYLTGEQFFHYAEYAKVPVPEIITLNMDTNLLGNVTYKWYWTIAGTTDWTLLDGETNSSLIVHYDGVYFNTGAREVTFRCVISNDTGATYEDIMTINVVRDGESTYRGALENENMTVPANADGTVSDWSDATTYATLKRGGTKIENADYTLTSSQITGVGTLSIDQAQKQITVNTSSIPKEYIVVQWQINFVYDGETVDTVTLHLSKNMAGKDGDVGNSSIQIYCNTNNTPSRPTFTSMISSSGGSSGVYTWYPDPTNSTTTLTWTSTGYFNPNTQKIDTLPDGSGYRWTTPVIHSPLNGEPGEPGVGIMSVVMEYFSSTSQTDTVGSYWVTNPPPVEKDRWTWTRLKITYSNGSTATTDPVCVTAHGETGDYGPGLSYRGEYVSTTPYGWTTNDNGNVRDVVKYDDAFYAVNSWAKGSIFTGRKPSSYYGEDGEYNKYWIKMNSFENVATDLLFADSATIAGWDFYNDNIQAQSGTMRLDGRTSSAVKSGIHLAIGSDAASSPGSAVFRVDTSGNCYANSLYAQNGGKIGCFTISSTGLTGSSNDIYDSHLSLSTHSISYGYAANNATWAAMGYNALSSSSGNTAVAVFGNTLNNSSSLYENGTVIKLFNGNSNKKSLPQRWIECSHYDSSQNSKSTFIVESRYDGVSQQRTYIKVGNLPALNHLSGVSSNTGTTYGLRVTADGYIFWE